MDAMIDGRNYSLEGFAMAMEKLGICGIQLKIASAGRAKMTNSLTNELKDQLLLAFQAMPRGEDYLRAYDLLCLALERVREKYEREDVPAAAPRLCDANQIALFKRVSNLRELEDLTA